MAKGGVIIGGNVRIEFGGMVKFSESPTLKFTVGDFLHPANTERRQQKIKMDFFIINVLMIGF